MAPKDFAATIERLGLSQVGAAAFLGVTDRAVRRWIAGDREVPVPVERFLRLLIAADISIEAARDMLSL